MQLLQLYLIYKYVCCLLPLSHLTGTGSATKFPCLPGTYSSKTDLFDASQCDICDAGKYCPAGEAAPRGDCPPGYYCPNGTRVAEQFPCPNGTYNPEFGKFSQDQCLNCIQGHFCEKATVQPAPCPIGKWSFPMKMQQFFHIRFFKVSIHCILKMDFWQYLCHRTLTTLRNTMQTQT